MDNENDAPPEAELTSEERNQLLLNALKNKLSISKPNNIQVSSIKPSQPLTLPKLKLPVLKKNTLDAKNKIQNNNNTNTGDTQSTTSLNNFLLQQLQRKRQNGEILETGNLILPKLQLGSSTSDEGKHEPNKFRIPKLSETTPNSSLAARQNSLQNVTSDFKNLKLESISEQRTDENLKKGDDFASIDLTSALSTNTNHIETPRKRIRTTTPAEEAKEIKPTQLLNIDEHCLIDWSTVKLNDYLVEASPLGQHICHQFEKRPVPKIDHTFKTKYHIEPFDFSTDSPDDKVLASLLRCKREYL